jgi:hypothetical protein
MKQTFRNIDFGWKMEKRKRKTENGRKNGAGRLKFSGPG